jgi:hypothetical protein
MTHVHTSAGMTTKYQRKSLARSIKPPPRLRMRLLFAELSSLGFTDGAEVIEDLTR